MQVVVHDEDDGDEDDDDDENEDDVHKVDEHDDNNDDEFDDDDGFDHDDHYNYDVQKAMPFNDDEAASLQRMVNEDRESREMMFEVSTSGNHALVRGVTQNPDNIFADEEEQNNEPEENISKFVDENTKEMSAEREEGTHETEVQNEVVLGDENEEEAEKEMAETENAIEVQTANENAKEFENEEEG
ncbi:nucleolin-like [Helianthus annuus]|uniref:nucleolin-like n=1 Tax=Helianthus annuus TaxID=4232 RepID=UPI000B8F90F5|nr:nucleolin-like [Helianthus annuus]